MRRKYLRELYAERVKRIKSNNPDSCIGVDVIVGFPGETEIEFEDTVNFIKDLDISYLHVFTYSERANTTARKMAEAVPMNVRKERSKQLQILSNKKRRAFYETQLGKTKSVLFEGEENQGTMYGFTENYVKVKIPFAPEFVNEIKTVNLLEIDRDGVVKVDLV